MAKSSILGIATSSIALLITACGGEGSPHSTEQVAEADQALTSTRIKVVCTDTESTDADLTLSVSASGKTLSVILGLENQVRSTGTLDERYEPGQGNTDFVQFVGFPALRDGDENVAFLVEKTILDRRPGRAKFQQRGYDQAEYVCKPF